MPDRSRYALTPAQRDELLRLQRVGAISLETSRSVVSAEMRGGNPNVFGILVDKGYVLTKVRVTPGGSRAMHYWLTEAGALKAAEISRG